MPEYHPRPHDPPRRRPPEGRDRERVLLLMPSTMTAGPVIVDACPLCGSDHFRTAFQEPPWSVRRCERCGLAWVSTRLDEAGLQEIYKSEVFWRSPSPKTRVYADYRGDESLYLATFRKRMRFVLR